MSKPDWEGFCRDILEEWPTRDVDGGELFDLCVKHHMIREVPGGYKEGQHIDAECIFPEEGDPWYEYNFPAKRAADRIEELEAKLAKMHRSRDRYREAWEEEKARFAKATGDT